jgi:hypothetical protein
MLRYLSKAISWENFVGNKKVWLASRSQWQNWRKIRFRIRSASESGSISQRHESAVRIQIPIHPKISTPIWTYIWSYLNFDKTIINTRVLDAEEENRSDSAASEGMEEGSDNDSLSDIITRAQGDLGSVLQTPANRRPPPPSGKNCSVILNAQLWFSLIEFFLRARQETLTSL